MVIAECNTCSGLASLVATLGHSTKKNAAVKNTVQKAIKRTQCKKKKTAASDQTNAVPPPLKILKALLSVKIV